MKVNGTTPASIDVSDYEAKRIAREVILKISGLRDDWEQRHFLRKEELILLYGRWDDEDVVRKATDLDIAALRILKELNK